MAHYLIFLPGVTGTDTRHLVNAGLGDLLREGEPGPDTMECDRGPDGKPGLLLTWRTGDLETDPRFMMHDKLKWTSAPSVDHPELGKLEAGRYWVGVDEENPPQPADLARPSMISGLSITLADGYSWSVPTISRFPNRYQLNDGGEITRVIKDEYHKFYEAGMRVVAEVMQHFSTIEEIRDKVPDIDDYSIPVTAKNGLVLIAQALALNYRINWELAFLLDLLDERSGAMALLAFCELGQIKEVLDEKKKLPPVSINVGWYSKNTATV